MSAYMCNKEHIDYLLTAALSRKHGPLSWWDKGGRFELTYETVNRVGAMLISENQASLTARYGEAEEVEPYIFTRYYGTIDPVQVLKSISCYEYQACEHDGWETSEAHDFCRALRHDAINRLPGYSDAEWGAPKPRVARQKLNA